MEVSKEWRYIIIFTCAEIALSTRTIAQVIYDVGAKVVTI